MKGLQISENPMGLCAIRLHYTADEMKDPEHSDPAIAAQAQRWLDRVRLIYPDPNEWEREMEINFFVTAGTRVFPQFNEQMHCRPLAFNRHKAIYRGWDFGWRAPCVLFAQVDARDRLLILGELVSAEKSTRDFAQLVIQRGTEWFGQQAAGYSDFCDPAGQQVKSIDSERSERRDVEVLAGLGISPAYEYGWSRKDGRSLVHQLLAPRTDGTPSLYLDAEHAPLLAQAFLGQYVFKEKLSGGVNDEPDDDTHPWADVMAALRYLVVGLQRRLSVRPLQLGFDESKTEDLYAGIHGYGTKRRKMRDGPGSPVEAYG